MWQLAHDRLGQKRTKTKEQRTDIVYRITLSSYDSVLPDKSEIYKYFFQSVTVRSLYKQKVSPQSPQSAYRSLGHLSLSHGSHVYVLLTAAAVV